MRTYQLTCVRRVFTIIYCMCTDLHLYSLLRTCVIKWLILSKLTCKIYIFDYLVFGGCWTKICPTISFHYGSLSLFPLNEVKLKRKRIEKGKTTTRKCRFLTRHPYRSHQPVLNRSRDPETLAPFWMCSLHGTASLFWMRFKTCILICIWAWSRYFIGQICI